MEHLKRLVSTIEHLSDSKSKQHIVGGLLFSAAIFLGALATTVITVRIDSTSRPVDEDVYLDEQTYEDEYDHDYGY